MTIMFAFALIFFSTFSSVFITKENRFFLLYPSFTARFFSSLSYSVLPITEESESMNEALLSVSGLVLTQDP